MESKSHKNKRNGRQKIDYKQLLKHLLKNSEIAVITRRAINCEFHDFKSILKFFNQLSKRMTFFSVV